MQVSTSANLVEEVPLIVSPSYVKISYLNPLIDLWSTFHGSGMYNAGVAIIGFSLPGYDEYVRQPLYTMIRNFVLSDTAELCRQLGTKKRDLKFVDFRDNKAKQDEYRDNFRFVDWKSTPAFFDGFGAGAIDYLFE